MNIKIIASSSKGNCYLIDDNKTFLLLEAGIPIKQIMAGCDFKLNMVQGCLITHEHKDHSKAANDMIKRGIDIYTSLGTISACGLTGHRIHAVKAQEVFLIGSFTVMAFDVQHDAKEPLGFLIYSEYTGEKLLFFSDSFYIKYRFPGLTHIMCECNYSLELMMDSVHRGYIPATLAPRIMKSHMSLEHLIQMLQANDLSNVKQIYLLHMSENNSDPQRFKEEVQKATGVEVYVG